MTMTSQTEDTYSVSWKAQQSHMVEEIRNLFCQVGGLLDVTIACDGEYIQAHKLVLSVCSSFFKDLFQKNRADKSNTIVILGNVTARNMRYLLRYMYEGKVEIPNRHLDGFLQAGNLLKVEGLVKTMEVTPQIKPIAVRASCDNTSFSSKVLKLTVRKRPSNSSIEKKRRRVEKDAGSSNFADADNNDYDSDESGPETDFNPKSEPFSDEGRSDKGDDDEEFDTAKSEKKKNEAATSTSKFPSVNGAKARPIIRRRRRNAICWQYFEPNNDHSEAICKFCTDKPTIIKTKLGSTTGLLRHLASIHPGVMQPPQGYPRINIAGSSRPRSATNDASTQVIVKQSSAIDDITATTDNDSHQLYQGQTTTPTNENQSHHSTHTGSDHVHELLQSSYNVLNDDGLKL